MHVQEFCLAKETRSIIVDKVFSQNVVVVRTRQL